MGRATALLLLVCLVNLPTSAVAQAAGDCDLGTAAADLDIGNVRARMYNLGGLFWFRGSPVYEVPKGSGSNAIFASGLWTGGMVDGDLRMAAATYADWEFWPGPLDDNGDPPADCSAYDRIYVVSREDVESYERHGTPALDLAEWPVDLGAPVLDGDGDPDNYDLAAGDRPDLLGDQMAWWVMNDAGNRHLTTETSPIGLEVRVSAFAFAFERDDAIGNTTFYRYQLVYRGTSQIEDMYFGFWAEPDLGDSGDDYVGSDSLLGLGFVYNGDDYDGGSSGYGYSPPALGYDILRGPLADTDGLDNDYDGVVDEPGETLSMTSMMVDFHGGSVQGHPSFAAEYYTYLRARWRDGQHLTYGGSGLGFSNTPTNYMFSADPPAFWSEENIDDRGTRNPPGDRNFIVATGPFRMEPGDTEDIWLAIIWSDAGDRLESVRRLKADSRAIQTFFDTGDLPLVIAPSSPPMLLAPGDGATGQPTNVSLRWSSVQHATRYIWQVATDSAFRDLVASGLSGTQTTVETPRELAHDTPYYWRVQGVSKAGAGPWSDFRSFSFSADSLTDGRSGAVMVDGSYMFVEVAGPDDRYACGESAGSRFGCDQVGGNFVYPSFNGSGEYIMYHEGTGPEQSLDAFAPNDYEIRFTERGSYAYHPFTTGNAIWVPFEVWDIGPTYTGTNVNANDPADDVQLIPNLFVGGRTECEWKYDEAVPGAFGVFGGSTQRVYAYYPTDTYEAWADGVRPLVEADPDGCPNAYDLTGAAIEEHIDFGRGRPLQRIVFFGDPEINPPHPAFDVVVRFYTMEPIYPSVPVPSAPTDGATGLSLPVELYWSAPRETVRLQIATTADFEDPIVDEEYFWGFQYSFRGFQYRPGEVPAPGQYFWRLYTRSWLQEPEWSPVWSFTIGSATGVEDESLPDRFALHPNYPNPFNPETMIRFDLPSQKEIRLEVFDALGRRVATLIDHRLPPGRHRVPWQAGHLASGLYLYRLTAGSFTQSRAMILVK